jgi:transcriptional antiterminator NusG
MQNELTRDIWNEVIAKPHLSPAKVKVLVNMFGRETPVEFEFSQIEKI